MTAHPLQASRRQDCSSWASLVGAACPQLTRLALHCKEVKPGLFQGLQACPLTHLELACGISSEAQQELSQLQPCLPFLTSLTVHRDEESISCLLRKFGHQLTSASMCSETGQAIAWLESLSQCTRLERLSIHGEQCGCCCCRPLDGHELTWSSHVCTSVHKCSAGQRRHVC